MNFQIWWHNYTNTWIIYYCNTLSSRSSSCIHRTLQLLCELAILSGTCIIICRRYSFAFRLQIRFTMNVKKLLFQTSDSASSVQTIFLNVSVIQFWSYSNNELLLEKGSSLVFYNCCTYVHAVFLRLESMMVRL